MLAFIYVGCFLYHIQITRHDELYSKAKRMYTAVKTREGIRGEIFDYNGNLLVGNIPVVDVYCDPSLVGDEAQCQKIAQYFANRAGCDYDLIYRRLMDKEIVTYSEETQEKRVRIRRFAVIEKGIEFNLGQQLKNETAELKFKGLMFKNTFRRSYPKGRMLANILGFSSIDNDKLKAVMGLEKTFDEQMQSTDSTLVYERGRDGRIVSYSMSELEDGHSGYDIYLTVQEPIQAILEEELDKLYEKSRPIAAYAVMADPFTGNILAIAQRPTYDPNDRSTMDPQAYLNRIASDVMEPGSIMKPFVIASALDMGIITPDTLIDCGEGIWYYGGKPLRDSHRIGLVPVTEVVKQSSNIGTAKIALMMGEENLDRTLRAFGFGKKTGLPLKPETSGIFRPINKWDKLSITRFCIGQGIAASPLQLVQAYCMLANGGYPISLRLVDRLDNGESEKRFPTEVGPCFFKRPETYHEILSMMKKVTEPGGTATRAAVPGYYVASKTGTSEKFIDGAYRKKYVASFCGFVPADRPKFVLLVTCDEPQGGYYGGAVAGPTFSAIAERTLKYLHIPPDTDLDTWYKEREILQKEQYKKRLEEDARVRARREARQRARQ